jgi:UPF0755 protein
MIDELDLAFDDDSDRRPPRSHRRGGNGGPTRGGRGRKGRRGRSFVALFLVLLLLGGLGLAGWWGVGKVQSYFAVKDYSGPGSGDVQIQILNGDSATDIANNLYNHQVVKSGKAFVDAANANSNAKGIEPGFYKLHQHMQAKLAVAALLARDTGGALINKISRKVTIREGEIALDIFKELSAATKIPVAQFTAAAKDPIGLGVPDWWFTRGDGKAVDKTNIEGFLYPATYEFDPNADAKTILSAIVNNFNTEIGKLGFADHAQKGLNLSPYEVLVAASIAQVEAVRPADMAGVARVLYNRAYSGNFACSCLGLDSEVNYWLRISGKEAKDSGNLTQSQLHDPADPYNTHDKPGLPIGPISNPGADALTGAMTAPKSNNFYFLAINKQGDTAFASNSTQFEQLRLQACHNGINIC